MTMIYLSGEGPDTEASMGYMDSETGYDLTQPLGFQQRLWESPEDRELLARLKERREKAGLPDIDDHIVRSKIASNTPTSVGEKLEPTKPRATHKGAKKAVRGRGKQVESARTRAASLHGDLETN